MEAKRKHIIYKEEFRRQAVEMVIHSGKTQAQVRPMLGFKRFETAAVTIRGIELAEKIKKHQFNLRPLTGKATTAPEMWVRVLAA